MNPMIDSLMVPGLATAVFSVGPGLLGVGLVLLAGLAWVIRGTNAELGRAAADRRGARPGRIDLPALAA